MFQPLQKTRTCNHVKISQNLMAIRIPKLSQRELNMFTKELKRTNMLTPDVRMHSPINRHHHYTQFSKSDVDNLFIYCTNIHGLV